METIRWLLLLLRVDNYNFLATLGLALLMHYGGIIWQPLSSHCPDLSSGMYICSVLMLLMRPLSHSTSQPSCYLWLSLCTDSLKMLLALLLLQHVALLCLWDPCSWVLYYTLFAQAAKFRMLLAFFLLCFSVFKVLQTRLHDCRSHGVTDSDGDAIDNGVDYDYNERVEYINHCPYCARQQVELLEQHQKQQQLQQLHLTNLQVSRNDSMSATGGSLILSNIWKSGDCTLVPQI